MWEKVSVTSLTRLLDLVEFRVTHFENRGGDLYLKCESRFDVAQCPSCKRLSSHIHQRKERRIRDLRISGKRVTLYVESRRFACDDCEKPFTESLASVDARRRQTRRYEQNIYEQCLHSDRKAIAQGEHLSESTVKDIFVKWSQKITRDIPQHRVRILGIDELALKKRHKQYVLILSDLERHCILAVLPDRKKRSLINWLQAHPNRQDIKVVSTDMWEPYRQAIKTVLPDAQQVADRFHIMKQLNQRLTQARRSIQKKADSESYTTLKGSRWILVKARHDLSSEEERKLQQILMICPELRVMYLLKEEFRTICDKVQNREQAARFLCAWICKVKATNDKRLLKFVKTLTNWWHEFLNYFIERVTQGFVEGINNAIRATIRRAFGFRNFDIFRLQILAQYGGS
ncbi:MAG: ISL3 family transposase [Euryarchaeota archaeon]|jgi:transposase|nr:ISL3 family transposase [Euryarchaeota archaeon]